MVADPPRGHVREMEIHKNKLRQYLPVYSTVYNKRWHKPSDADLTYLGTWACEIKTKNFLSTTQEGLVAPVMSFIKSGNTRYARKKRRMKKKKKVEPATKKTIHPRKFYSIKHGRIHRRQATRPSHKQNADAEENKPPLRCDSGKLFCIDKAQI